MEKTGGTDVFGVASKKSDLLSKINKHLSCEGVHISQGDKLPKCICSECEIVINNFTEFCNMVNQVQKRLEQEKQRFKEISTKTPTSTSKSLTSDINQQIRNALGLSESESTATVSVGPDGKVECKLCQNYLEAVEHTTLHMVSHGIGTVICHCRVCGHQAELAQFIRGSNGREEKSVVWCESCQFQRISKSKECVKTKSKKHKQMLHHCEICSKVFHSKAHLNRHQIVHSGAKPFLCEVCGTGFSQKSSLKLHVMSHTGLNPHKCDICGQCFRFKPSLQSHIISLHWPTAASNLVTKKQYCCDHCGKQFATAYKLKRHYRCHTGERPYECDECGRLFSQSCNFNLHRKKHSQLSLSDVKESSSTYDSLLNKNQLPEPLLIKPVEQFSTTHSAQHPNTGPPNTVSFGSRTNVILEDANDSEFLETILQNPVVSLEVGDEPLNSIDTVLLDPSDKSSNPSNQFLSLSSQFASRPSHITSEFLSITDETDKKPIEEKSSADLFPDFTHDDLIYINQTSNLPTDNGPDSVSLPTFSSLQTSSVGLTSIPH